METAIHRYDPVVFLLVGLGASLNVGLLQSYNRSWTKGASLLEAVEELIKKIDKNQEFLRQPTGPESMEVDHANQPEWRAWIAKSNKAVKDFGEKGKKEQQHGKPNNQFNRMKDYLEEVLALLKEKKAKTWNELHPEAAVEKKEKDSGASKQEPPVIPFQVWTSDWWALPVSKEKVSLYEELYEACWNGDDEKICELCLPPSEGTTRKVAPIQIVCKTTEGGKFRCSSISRSTLTRCLQNSLRCTSRSIVVTGRQ